MAAPVEALRALDQIAVPDADVLVCQRWLGDVRRVRGFLDSVEAVVLSRIDTLAATGESFGSEDTSVRCSGVSSREAAKLKSRSQTLDHADGFGEALAAGDVTAEHVDKLAAVTATLNDEVRDSLLGQSAELLEHATGHDPARFGRHVRDLARNLERQHGISRDRQQHDATVLTWKVAADGMYDIHARLHPILGNRLIRALDAEVAARIAAGEQAGDPDCVNRTINRNRVAAEALVDLVSAQNQELRPAMADITVLIDADTLTTGEAHQTTVCETGHGAPVPVESIRALPCNSTITPVIAGHDGIVLNVGRTTRVPNRAQRRALRAMYRTCAAAGCEIAFERCELHHIHPWETGGPTDLHNLIPACSRHHHQIHTHDWRLELDTDRTLTVTDRHGHTVMVTTPDMPSPKHRRTRPAPAGHPTQHAS